MQRKLRVIVNAIPLVNVNTGIGRYIRSLYSEIERQFGAEVEILYFDGHKARREMPSGPENLESWSGIAELFWKLPVSVAYAVRLARHALLERRFMQAAKGCDVYHETAFFPFKAPAGTATVFTVHDLSLMRHPQWHPAERVKYFNRFFNKRLALAQRLIAVSEYTRSEMTRLLGVSAESVDVVLQGALQVFSPASDEDVRRVKDVYNVPERYFLFVGSGDPRKNAGLIPRALEAADVGVPLVSVGWSGWGGHDRAGVHAIGYVEDSDLAALYSGALGLVFPSEYEGFGLPILEAMACGCPVVAARRASLPEVGGDAALWVDDTSAPDELGEVLARVAGSTELRAEMSRKGLERATEFSWSRFAAQTFDILQSARSADGRAS